MPTTTKCPACAAEYSPASGTVGQAAKCPSCGAAGSAALPPPPPPTARADSTGGIMPYHSPKALIAYYLGIFGLFPFIGIVLSVPAIILGVLGLREYRRTPVIKGVVHAWIGIILGALSTCYNLLFIVLLIVGLVGGSRL